MNTYIHILYLGIFGCNNKMLLTYLKLFKSGNTFKPAMKKGKNVLIYME